MKRSNKKRKDVTLNLSDLTDVITCCIEHGCVGSLAISAVGLLCERVAVGWHMSRVEFDIENKKIILKNDNPSIEDIVVDSDEEGINNLIKLKDADVYSMLEKDSFSLVEDWLMYSMLLAPKRENA